jgi:hypothetical protein
MQLIGVQQTPPSLNFSAGRRDFAFRPAKLRHLAVGNLSYGLTIVRSSSHHLQRRRYRHVVIFIVIVFIFGRKE